MPHLTGLRCIQHRGYLAGFDGAVFGRRAKGAARETGLALRVDASAAVELSGTRAASTAIAASLRTASVPASCSAASLSAPGASKRPDGVGCAECGRRSWAQSPPSKSALEAKRGAEWDAALAAYVLTSRASRRTDHWRGLSGRCACACHVRPMGLCTSAFLYVDRMPQWLYASECHEPGHRSVGRTAHQLPGTELRRRKRPIRGRCR